MDILLVSGRSRRIGANPWLAAAATIAADLAARGHAVDWIRVIDCDDGAALPTLPGVETVNYTASARLPFRSVLAPLGDLRLEELLTRRLRQSGADVVHLLGFGGVNSVELPWIAAGFGIPAVVSAIDTELFCHRGSLVDSSGARCREVGDPARCTACCLTPFDGGLSPRQARAGRFLRSIGDASPYPNLTAFRNRLDSIIGGLAFARAVLVVDTRTRDTLVDLGLASGLIEIETSVSADLLETRYTALLSTSAHE